MALVRLLCRAKVAHASLSRLFTGGNRHIAGGNRHNQTTFLKNVHAFMMQELLEEERKGGLKRTLKKDNLHGDLVNLLRDLRSFDMMTALTALEQAERDFCPKIADLHVSGSLQVLDTFLGLNYQAKDFLYLFFKYVEQLDFDDLKPHEITRFMFYVFASRESSTSVHIQLEQHLLKNLHSFHINSVGIISLGCFGSEYRIQSAELLDMIGVKLLKDFDMVESKMFINILKLLRFSGFKKISFYKDLASKLVQSSYIKTSMSQNNLMHIAVAYAALCNYSKELTQALLERFLTLMDETSGRPKDIAKFVWALGFLYHEPERERESYLKLLEAYRNCPSNMNEKNVIESHSHIVQGLNYLGIYPPDLISYMLHPKTVHRIQNLDSTKMFQSQLINHTAKYELPGYRASTLPKEMTRISKHDHDFNLAVKKGIQEVFKSLQSILGTSYVRLFFALPHFHLLDIELRLDSENRPVNLQLNDQQFTYDSTELKDIRKIVIQVLGQKQVFVNNGEMTGHFLCKLRQLRSIGYEPLLIQYEESKHLLGMEEPERQQYLLEVLQERVGLKFEPYSAQNKL